MNERSLIIPDMDNQRQNQLINFYKRYRRLPTYSEMLRLFDLKSKNAVYKIVQKLIDAGVVTKDKNGKLSPGKLYGEVKVLGLVEAGFPSPAEEELADTLTIDDYLIENREATFLLKVKGDSMIEAGIQPGDMVIVERNREPKDGDIVIAEIDHEWTMKYYRKSGNRIFLEPANKKYRPIYPTDELKIAAIVRAVIRKY